MLFLCRKSRSIGIHLICQVLYRVRPFHAWAPKGQCFLDHSWSKAGGANTGAALASSSTGAPPSLGSETAIGDAGISEALMLARRRAIFLLRSDDLLQLGDLL